MAGVVIGVLLGLVCLVALLALLGVGVFFLVRRRSGGAAGSIGSYAQQRRNLGPEL